jgi:hypothetical protein
MSHMPALDQPEDPGTGVANTRTINTTAPLTGGGDLSADRTIALADGGITTAKLFDGAVTLAKMANMSTSRLLGRVTGGTGVPEALTGTQATTLLDAFTSALKGLVPASGGGTVNFLRADGTFAEPPGTGGNVINVQDADYGALGDGTTDDVTAINSAADAAVAAGFPLYFPAGRYLVSRCIEIPSNRGLRVIFDAGAIVVWPSDDASVVDDAFTNGDEMARAAFALRYCSGVTFENVTGQGGDDPDLDVNIGSLIYASNCVDTTVRGCTAVGGSALFVQDASNPTSGTGDSLAVSSGVVTVTDAAGSFQAGHVGLPITISGCTNEKNNGPKIIKSVISSTQLTYEDADGTAETSSFRWEIADNDRGTLIERCRSLNQRGSLRVGSDSVVRDCVIERPTSTLDLVGLGTSFSISGTTVTLTCAWANFPPSIVNKYIRIQDATSAGNETGGGNPLMFKITSRPSATTVTYENASGVTEAFPGYWWIANGDKASLGAGVGAISHTGTTTTLTVATAMFTANDVDKTVRVGLSTTAENSGAFTIAAVNSSTEIEYENTDGSATSEAFAGVVTVDSFDRSGGSSAPRGSSHGAYLQAGQAGRRNVKFINNTWKGIRTVAIKGSASAAKLLGCTVIGDTFIECGCAIEWGGDDSQEHTSLTTEGISIIDCGTQREGATQARCISIIGSRGVTLRGSGHFTRNAIGSVNGLGISAVTLIHGSRYVARGSQPIEDVTIDGFKFTRDPYNTSRGSIATYGVSMTDVGTRAYWGTITATLAISGSTMTLTDSAVDFNSDLVGRSITIVNATTAGNNGTFTILTASGSTLTYTNASGANASAGNSGTYRIPERSGGKAGGLVIRDCYFGTVANSAIQTSRCVGTDVDGCTFANGTINFDDDCNPRVGGGSRFTGQFTQNAIVRFNTGCSWPILEHGITVTNPALGPTAGYGVAVGTGSTPVDHPLLGRSGIIAATETVQQMVVPYGANWVDGDTVVVTGTTYTYKTTAPGATEFNSKASLIALIDAQANHNCVEFGTHLTVNVATGHLLIEKTTAAGTDGDLTFSASTLNPQACPYLRNDGSTQAQCKSRGSGDEAIIWTPVAAYWGTPVLVANDAGGKTLLAGSYIPAKNDDNSGCCEVVTLDAGAGEIRWRY